MKLFFAGWQASRRARELVVIKRAKIKNRCFSFANLVKIDKFPYFINGFQGSYEACLDNGVGIFLDSGVVSFRGYKRALEKRGGDLSLLPSDDKFVRMYADYCKANMSKWDFCVTVDMEPKVHVTWEWHNKLLKLGVKAVPVFHGDDSVDWIKRYADLGHSFIMLGGSYMGRSARPRLFRQYLDTVFNLGVKLNMTFHGLGMTTPWVMLEYPWASVDSSWWTRSAGYGSIMRFDPVAEKVSLFHISTRSKQFASAEAHFKQNAHAMDRLRVELKEEGFDLKLLQEDFTERHVFNAIEMMKLCAAATRRHKSTWNQLL